MVSPHTQMTGIQSYIELLLIQSIHHWMMLFFPQWTTRTVAMGMGIKDNRLQQQYWSPTPGWKLLWWTTRHHVHVRCTLSTIPVSLESSSLPQLLAEEPINPSHSPGHENNHHRQSNMYMYLSKTAWWTDESAKPFLIVTILLRIMHGYKKCEVLVQARNSICFHYEPRTIYEAFGMLMSFQDGNVIIHQDLQFSPQWLLKEVVDSVIYHSVAILIDLWYHCRGIIVSYLKTK